MTDTLNISNIARRLQSNTPPFWKQVRTVMLTIGGISGVLLAAPVALPAFVITIAGYGVVVGSVGTVLSQMTTE